MEVLFLAAVATVVGFFIIALNKRPPAYMPMRGPDHPELGEDADLLGSLTLEHLSGACVVLAEQLGLQVESVEQVEVNEAEVRALDPKPLIGGIYIITGLLLDPESVVEPAAVTNLRSVVRDENAVKGILVTNGVFSAPAVQMLDAEHVELINGAQLIKLIGRQAFNQPVA